MQMKKETGVKAEDERNLKRRKLTNEGKIGMRKGKSLAREGDKEPVIRDLEEVEESKEQDFEATEEESLNMEEWENDYEGQMNYEESDGMGEIDFGEDGGEPEEWNGESVWEEEEEPAKPWKTALVFLALMGVAVIICTVLWQFSHRDEPEGQGTDVQPSGMDSVEADDGSDSADNDDLSIEIISGTKDMKFTSVKQSVTPRDVVNLRSVPSILDTDNIETQAKNGEVLLRTGINEDTGWSKVEYEGKTLYAATQYLTLDLEYKPSVDTSNPNRVSTMDGRIILFSDCDDWISPKEYVNLRTEPSTSEGQGTVSCQLNYGEKAHRTGISLDSGWSRVEYNDQVLYVVTSLINELEGEDEDPEDPPID